MYEYVCVSVYRYLYLYVLVRVNINTYVHCTSIIDTTCGKQAHVLELAGDHVERGTDGVRVARDGYNALRARAVRDVNARRALHAHHSKGAVSALANRKHQSTLRSSSMRT